LRATRRWISGSRFATRRTSAPSARSAATLAATNVPKPGCRVLGYRLETTRIRTRSGRPHIVILDENLPVPLDRRVWQEALALVGAGTFAVRARFRREHVDVVEAHIAYPTGLVARPVAAALGAPLVLFAHGADVRDLRDRSQRHARLAASTLGAASLVVANSDFLAGEIARRFPEVADRVRVLTPGIELDRFVPGPAEERSGVLFVGRLVPRKGADVLVEAVARLGTDFRRLTVIGDGPERERIASLAADRGVELDLRGELGRAETARAMARAAVVAVPSVYEEPLGLVALEAMAAGAIVVASAAGGLRETVIDGETGFTVPPGDAASLAATLERAVAMATDPTAAAPVRAAARSMAVRHDVRQAARDSLAWYGTLHR